MLRVMAAGVVAIAVGAMGGLIFSPQAAVESTHSIVAIDTTAASAPLASLPGSVSDAAERTRTAALSRPRSRRHLFVRLPRPMNRWHR